MSAVTRRDRTIRRNVAHFFVRQLRANRTPTILGNLMRFMACRHRLVYGFEPIPLARMLPR